ncbi:hypothetical protein JTP67_35765, partial [Streptomyces sp. S12]|nr:hypothetical protein [Streptomyces sp. S12]
FPVPSSAARRPPRSANRGPGPRASHLPGGGGDSPRSSDQGRTGPEERPDRQGADGSHAHGDGGR